MTNPALLWRNRIRISDSAGIKCGKTASTTERTENTEISKGFSPTALPGTVRKYGVCARGKCVDLVISVVKKGNPRKYQSAGFLSANTVEHHVFLFCRLIKFKGDAVAALFRVYDGVTSLRYSYYLCAPICCADILLALSLVFVCPRCGATILPYNHMWGKEHSSHLASKSSC